MSVDTRRKALATGWTIVVLLIAFFSDVESRRGWLAASVIAFGPAFTLLYFSKEPAQTTSQRISDARR